MYRGITEFPDLEFSNNLFSLLPVVAKYRKILNMFPAQ